MARAPKAAHASAREAPRIQEEGPRIQPPYTLSTPQATPVTTGTTMPAPAPRLPPPRFSSLDRDLLRPRRALHGGRQRHLFHHVVPLRLEQLVVEVGDALVLKLGREGGGEGAGAGTRARGRDGGRVGGAERSGAWQGMDREGVGRGAASGQAERARGQVPWGRAALGCSTGCSGICSRAAAGHHRPLVSHDPVVLQAAADCRGTRTEVGVLCVPCTPQSAPLPRVLSIPIPPTAPQPDHTPRPAAARPSPPSLLWAATTAAPRSPPSTRPTGSRGWRCRRRCGLKEEEEEEGQGQEERRPRRWLCAAVMAARGVQGAGTT